MIVVGRRGRGQLAGLLFGIACGDIKQGLGNVAQAYPDFDPQRAKLSSTRFPGFRYDRVIVDCRRMVVVERKSDSRRVAIAAG